MPDGPIDTVEIDGSRGEGGGQILRTSLALAMITGRPLRMRRIRAGRAKPGLRRQHLACVEAAAQLSHAEVRGATLGSQDLEFVPRAITGGELEIDPTGEFPRPVTEGDRASAGQGPRATLARGNPRGAGNASGVPTPRELAELVAQRACDELAAFLAAGVPVGEHLADQLILPLAVAGGGRFRSAPLSLHATTNIETIRCFLEVAIRVDHDGDAVIVTVG